MRSTANVVQFLDTAQQIRRLELSSKLFRHGSSPEDHFQESHFTFCRGGLDWLHRNAVGPHLKIKINPSQLPA